MKIVVIGHFMYGDEACNGQAIKTRNLVQALRVRYPGDIIEELDTNHFSSRPLRNVASVLHGALRSDFVIVLPTKRLLLPIACLLWLCRLVSRSPYLYVVIGGWLPEYCLQNSRVSWALGIFSRIYVETRSMCDSLSHYGVRNVEIAPNFSTRPSIDISELTCTAHSPLRLCTFSRVIEEKGILEAICVTRRLCEEGVSCTLDIYGPCDEVFQHRLEEFLHQDDHVKLAGVLNGIEVTRELSAHDVLLFPTFYEGEGFPGALIDAFGAGLPIVCSDWHDNRELVEDGETGFVVPAHDIDAFVDRVVWLVRNQDELYEMRLACLSKRQELYPETALCRLFSFIDDQCKGRSK